jgi:hypothetical protein
MKKTILGLAALALLASCNNDEELNSLAPEAITFGNAFVDNSTRAMSANDPSYGSSNPLTQFKVWGTVKGEATAVSIFNGQNVAGTVGVDNVWNCTEKTQYWIKDALYNFVAVVNGTVSADNNALPKSIAYNADGSTDLLYARSQEYKGLASNNPLVKFDFKHLLSKVNFKVVNSMGAESGYTYSVKNIKITNAITSATYAINDTETTKNGVKTYTPNGTWTATATQGQAFDNIETVVGGTPQVCANEKLLIPINANVAFDIELYYNGTLITTTNISKVNVADLVAGNAYTFVINVGLDQPIQFTVEKNPTWTGGSGVDVE